MLFASVLLKSPQRPKNMLNSTHTVFEHSRAIFAAILAHIKSLKQIPQLWIDRECFVSTESLCAVTLQALKNPVGLRFDKGLDKTCEKSAIMERMIKSQAVQGIQSLTEDLFVAVPDPETEWILQLQNKTGIASIDIWRPKVNQIQDTVLVISDWIEMINKAQSHIAS